MRILPRLPAHERYKLAEVARRRMASHEAVMKMGLCFGAGETSYDYYELSDKDRALLEQVLTDTQSDDPDRRNTALFWWNRALETIVPGIPGGSFLLAGEPDVLDTVVDFFGFDVYQSFALNATGCTETVDEDGNPIPQNAAITGGSLSPKTAGQSNVQYKVAHVPAEWECITGINPDTGNPAVRFHQDGTNVRVRDEPLEHFSNITNYGNATFWLDGALDDFGGGAGCTPPGSAIDEFGGGAAEEEFSTNTSLLDPDACIVVEIGKGAGWDCARTICPGESFEWPPYAPTGSPTPVGGGGVPEGMPTLPIDPCDMIDELEGYPYTPPVNTPPIFTPDPGGITPEPGCSPGGGTPTPIDSGTVNPGDGGQVQLPTTPPGFTDPTAPGGIAPGYQPGDEICIDNGDGTQYCAPIDRVTPADPGPIIDTQPVIPSDRTTGEKICYGPDAGGDPVDVIDEISRALNDLGIESDRIIFDSECDKQLTRPMCFKAGTNKRRILNILLDLCGFCVYPQPDSNVIVGLCGPSDVHWYYHEDIDLIAWDLEYDGQEAFAFVRVFSPTFSELIPIPNPIGVPPDKIFHMEFPLGFDKHSAMLAGYQKVADLARQSLPLTGFHVPLNPLLRLRDQVHIRRPTRGFNGVYMATKLVNDWDQAAYLTQGLGRWLRGESLII